MLILSADQIRAWDEYTIRQTPIASIDLMERAATACFTWLKENGYLSASFSIFCGKGNNGGDGLALARLLAQQSAAKVSVFILESGRPGSMDFQTNLMRLHQTNASITFIQSEQTIDRIDEKDVVIDAIFGTGLSRPPEGMAARLIRHLNDSERPVIAIDIPSGLFADQSSQPVPANSQPERIVRANHTLSFQVPKLAFFVAENEPYTGTVHLLDIGLLLDFPDRISSRYETLTPPLIKAIYRPRRNFTHKGSYGHAALIAGSAGMAGAAVLAAKACLRSGVGKLSCYSFSGIDTILQLSIPEVVVKPHTAIQEQEFSSLHNAVGIGPGMGSLVDTNAALISRAMKAGKPLVIDADALNTLGGMIGGNLLDPDYKEKGPGEIPPLSILTPHPKEFERLFGPASNDFERLEKAREAAARLNVIIVLKGFHTLIAMPGGKAYFNTTGNPGMATAGSGDVLTGIIVALLAQHYTPEQAALLGVYLHGLAGDFAAAEKSQEAMIASDIIDMLGSAFLTIRNY